MASTQSNVDFICEQMAGAGAITWRKMFGEYGVYCDAKFIGVICDDMLFLKPTKPGREFAPDVTLAPAYDGAKPSLRIAPEQVEDADWLVALVRRTHEALPAKKQK